MAGGSRETMLGDIVVVEIRDRHDDLAEELRGRNEGKGSTPRLEIRPLMGRTISEGHGGVLKLVWKTRG